MSPAAFPAKSAREEILQRKGWIRVGLQTGAKSLAVTVAGPVRVHANERKILDSPNAPRFEGIATDGGISLRIGGNPLAASSSITIEPAEGNGFSIPGSGMYRGSLLLLARGKTFNVINVVRVDDYLKGVLPAEIGDAPPEALKAQAVAARSEAIRKLTQTRHASEGFDLCTKVHCMAYKGRAQETAAASLACEETFGVVLLSGGDVLDAVYHEVCGGTTAGADEVWDSPPIAGLVPVWDSDKDGGSPDLADEKQVAAFLFGPFAEGYCSPTGASYPKYARKYFRWTKTMSADELRSACGVSSVRSLEVIDRRKSGRVRKLRVTGDSGEKIFEKELPIRNTFGLYSGLFVMKPEIRGGHVASVQFAGAGHGHGVGLCQMGAWTMATRGQTWEQILAHYYRGARIEQIYRK